MRTLLFLCLIVAGVGGCANDDLYPLSIGSVQLQVEVADTAETQTQGLMFRESISETEGMLFVFDSAEPRAFHMRNTSVPLSIAYIDERLVIREIHDMEPYSLESVPSRGPAMYALEVNKGAFRRWGVVAGDRLILSDALAERIVK